MKTIKLLIIVLMTALISCEKEPAINSEETSENRLDVYLAVDEDVYKGDKVIEFYLTDCRIKSTHINKEFIHEVTLTGKDSEIYLKLKSEKDITKIGTHEFISDLSLIDSVFLPIIEFRIDFDKTNIEYSEHYVYDFCHGGVNFYNSKYYINFTFTGTSRAVVNYVK